ncbi:MAG TPA: ATP synthase F1 subunit epsilon [Candidatus Paceibacterota bacterium]|jgi:F-type H+-transporting ATPase subunit epsilon|nr:ATP synthase F1 subunit epsilon [Candidatus Paceibacterota bacterium]
MSKKLELKIVTPEKLILDEMVDVVVMPTTEGEVSVLADHVPMIAELASGDIVAISDGEHIPMAVVGGAIEVKKGDNGHTTVTVLADFAEHVSELSDEAIARAKARAEELRKQAENKEIVDLEHFTTELERSLTRVKIADKWRNKKYRI